MPLGREPMGYVFGQVPGLPVLLDVFLLEGGGHPLAPRFGHVRNIFLRRRRKLGCWSSRMDEQRKDKAWVKEGNPYPFIKAVQVMHLPACLKIRLFPKHHADDTVGLAMSVLMSIP